MPEYIKKCPECGSINLILNRERGEVICRDCGLVIEEKMVDFSQEWREFDSEQADKMRRTGAPSTWSVDYAEPIIVKNNDKIEIVKIGEFVDKVIDNSDKIKKQGNVETADVNGFEVVSFDKNYKTKFKPITGVSRHTIDHVYDIDIETGKNVKVTGSHSLFTVKSNKVVPIKVSDIKEGDFIVAPKKIPNIEGLILKIDLLDEFMQLNDRNIYLRGINDQSLFNLLKDISKEQTWLKDKIKNWKRHQTLPLYAINKLTDTFDIRGFNIGDAKIGIYSSGNELPLEISLDKDICKLLGYYTAEGTSTNDLVLFSFGEHERNYIDEVKLLVKKIFNVNAREEKAHKSAIQLSINSKLMNLLFTQILKAGRNAKEKRVPNIVYSLPKELKLAYLKTYTQGDGSPLVKKRENMNRPQVCISTTSVNKWLTNDIITLYSQLGMHANYQEAFINEHVIEKTGQKIKGSLSTRANVTNPDTALELGYIDELPKNNGKKAIENFIPAPLKYRKEWKFRDRLRIDRNLAKKIAIKHNDKELLKLVDSDFIFLRVKKIGKVKPSKTYVYDVSVPGYENFVGGRGLVYLHNTKFDKGLGTDIGQKGDIYKLDSKERNKFFRLRKWQYRVSPAIERNLKLALAELRRVASYLKLPQSVEEEAARTYTLAVQRGLVRGRSMESVVAGALYAACRRHEVPRTLDELSEASGIDKKEIGRTYRFVTRELGIRIMPSNPIDYIPRFASALKLTPDTQSKAVEILEDAQRNELTSGRGPTGIAAASLYVAALINNEKKTQREVADVAGVTEVTIRNRYKELLRKLNLKDQIKKKEAS